MNLVAFQNSGLEIKKGKREYGNTLQIDRTCIVKHPLVLGSWDGAVLRVLASNQCGLGSIPARWHMRVEFVVGCRLTPMIFHRVLWFSSFHKTNTPNSNSISIEELHDLASFLNIAN